MRYTFSFLLLLATVLVMASPSTVVFMPSTDIQYDKTWHLGQAVFILRDESRTVTDQALTYGVSPRIEAGVDAFSPYTKPVVLNAKVLLTEPGVADVPIAVGIYNVGAANTELDNRVAYIVGSKSTPAGYRISFGAYTANENVVGDEHTGAMVGAEYSKGSWWYGADFISGQNAIGTANVAVCHNFTPTMGVLVGDTRYNCGGIPDVYSVQFGVNFQ